MSRWRISLKLQAFFALLIAGLFTAVLYTILRYAGFGLVETYLVETSYEERANARYMDRFERWVMQEGIKATDQKKMKQWVQNNKQVYLLLGVVRDGEILLNEMYLGWESSLEDEEAALYLTRTILFEDGEAKVYLYGYFADRFYVYAMIAEILISVLCFLGIYLSFIQSKIKYILRLEKEVKILETGGLEHSITVKGRDELTSLARGINNMRISLFENMLKEQDAVKSNHNLVVAVAHDLRTPLTALMLYLDLICEGKYKNEEEFKEYLKRSRIKAVQIKNMSDDLFERFLLAKENEVVMEGPARAQYLLEDILSDFAGELENQGYQVISKVQWPDITIAVAMDYVARIMDNMSSNIIKYAEDEYPVVLTIGGKKQLMIEVSNHVKQQEEKKESTQVGVMNIKLMMEKMGGECEVIQNDEQYFIRLHFSESNI